MSSWIGVDLDGTLAEYSGFGSGEIGPPIPRMVARVKDWLAAGQEVRIFTARVANSSVLAAGIERWKIERPIEDWCRKHIGRALPITCEKDFLMLELWDDRCVQVIPNTGRRVDGGL